MSPTDEVLAWGVEAHGARLHIDSPFKPNRDDIWVFDAEWNRDGSCAGIGITTNGRDIHFYQSIADKDFFKDAKLCAHNAKEDVQRLRSWGFHVSPDQIVWDTMLAEYVKDSTTNEYGLKDLSHRKWKVKWPEYEELCGKGKTAIDISQIPLSVLANYNGCDVLFTHKMMGEQQADLTPEQLQYMELIELPTLRVLLEMEERGVQIDANYIRGLDKRFTDDLSGVSASIRNTAGAEINLNSHQQIKRSILEQTGLVLTTTKAEELAKHEEIPLIKDILRYRQLNKLKSTYTSVLLEEANGKDTYRLHARFNQTVTHTGRLSSSAPNLQNIPTRTDVGDAIRQGFVAKVGCTLIDSDFSQIEPRLMAHFSEDARLLSIFNQGQDLYDGVSAALGLPVNKESRKLTKTLWLALAYNAGAYKIAKTAGISFNKAQDFLNQMRKSFPELFYWKDQVIAQADIDGGVTTLFGRFIPLRKEWAHLGPNYKVQGSAAEVMKLAQIATRDFDSVLAVHDELVFEADPKHVAEIKSRMESVVSLKVPIVCEVGQGHNWSEAKG